MYGGILPLTVICSTSFIYTSCICRDPSVRGWCVEVLCLALPLFQVCWRIWYRRGILTLSLIWLSSTLCTSKGTGNPSLDLKIPELFPSLKTMKVKYRFQWCINKGNFIMVRHFLMFFFNSCSISTNLLKVWNIYRFNFLWI